MQIHHVGDRVQLLKADDPWNNSVGHVSSVRCDVVGGGREYKITFEGGPSDSRYHRDILVVKHPRVLKSQPVGEVPMTLPYDAKERKGMPITTGVLDYFPLAIAEVAKCSKAGNDQHNPGQPLHWDQTKSTDHADCMARHLIDRGSFDTDGVRHSAKLAWRALANLQLELVAAQEKK